MGREDSDPSPPVNKASAPSDVTVPGPTKCNPVFYSELPSGAGTADGATLPAGTVQSRTDFGAPGYGGPCPPKGDKPHRYIFTVFALKVDALPMVDANSPAAMVGYFLNANAIAKASLTAKYGRK